MAEKTIERTMSDTPSSPTVRIVPGAPPPAPVTRSQKKKRKTAKQKPSDPVPEEHVDVPDSTSAALIEKAPTESDVKEGSVAPELVAQPEETQSPVDENTIKLSPIIDMLSKRLKAIQKKIVSVNAMPLRLVACYVSCMRFTCVRLSHHYVLSYMRDPCSRLA